MIGLSREEQVQCVISHFPFLRNVPHDSKEYGNLCNLIYEHYNACARCELWDVSTFVEKTKVDLDNYINELKSKYNE